MAVILVVDDDPNTRKLLVTLLGCHGHRLLQAGDGAEALRAVRAERPDLVVSDLAMPVMDGYEFVRQLRTDPAVAGTRVVFFSAIYQQQEALALARACGVHHLLNKPARLEEILRVIHAALAGEPAAAPAAPPDTFDREHLRLLTDRLAEEVQELKTVNGRLRALLELSRQLARERDPRRLLLAFGQGARDILAARYAALGLLDPGGDRFAPFLVSGLDSGARTDLTPPRDGFLGRLLDAGHPVRLRDLRADPAAAEVLHYLPAARSFLGVPVAVPGQVYGVACFADKLGAAEFSAEDEQVAAALAAQFAVAHENSLRLQESQRAAALLGQEVAERRRTEQQLQTSLQELHALSAHLQSVREEERTNIAREIHDDLGQALTGLRMDVAWLQGRLKKQAAEDAAPLLDKTAAMIQLIDGSVQTVRRIATELRPAVLDALGLVAALEWQAQEFQRRTGLRCRFHSDREQVPTGRDQKTALFRIAQESLTNVARHAGATEVTVTLRTDETHVHLEVADNGKGIQEEEVARPRSLGLLGMRERVASLGGGLEITGRPGQGTTVRVSLPL